jgi:hypothetical protein
MKYHDYLKTEYWQQVSRKVKERGGYRCQVCNSPHDLQAHHRTYDHRGNELKHLDDLICLCRRCHAIFHGKVAEKKVKSIKSKGRKWVDQKAIPKEEMPLADENGFVTLTRELVEKCRTDKNGFTTATLNHLGVESPPMSGWIGRLIGNKITIGDYHAAINGRSIRV